MGMDSSFYRVGMNYKDNVPYDSENFIEQHRDTLCGYSPDFDARFHNFRTLQTKIEEMNSLNHDDTCSLEIEMFDKDFDELIKWTLENPCMESNVLMLTCMEGKSCLREGFRVFYSGNW